MRPPAMLFITKLYGKDEIAAASMIGISIEIPCSKARARIFYNWDRWQRFYGSLHRERGGGGGRNVER